MKIIEAKAKYFVEVSTTEILQELLQHPIYRDHPHLLLGSGSNILFTKDFEGIVIQCTLTGISISHENDDFLYLRVAAGEIWHNLVTHCVQHSWGGIENLSLIPGTVGAAPMQNIGAYGVEIKDVIETVYGIELNTGMERSFTNSDCKFNYRESIFKQELN